MRHITTLLWRIGLPYFFSEKSGPRLYGVHAAALLLAGSGGGMHGCIRREGGYSPRFCRIVGALLGTFSDST
jgi:hypothetical protein